LDEAETRLLLLAEYREVLTKNHPLAVIEEPLATHWPGGYLGGEPVEEKEGGGGGKTRRGKRGYADVH